MGRVSSSNMTKIRIPGGKRRKISGISTRPPRLMTFRLKSSANAAVIFTENLRILNQIGFGYQLGSASNFRNAVVKATIIVNKHSANAN